jgi:predicted aconitase
MVGVTPEAPTLAAALGSNAPKEAMTVTGEDIENVYRSYDLGDGRCDLIVFSGPQLSLFELKLLADLLDGRKVKAGTRLFVTTANTIKSEAAKLGYIGKIEAAGGVVLEGVCFYLLQNLTQIREKNGWTNLISNSAKIVNTITAHKFNTILRRTRECVEIACTGAIR